MECTLFVGKACLRGIVNGIGIGCYGETIGVLLLSDGVFLGVLIRYKKVFRNNYVFLFTFMYFVSLLCLDLYFCIEVANSSLVEGIDRDTYCLVAVLTMLLSILGNLIHDFGETVHKFYDIVVQRCRGSRNSSNIMPMKQTSITKIIKINKIQNKT